MKKNFQNMFLGRSDTIIKDKRPCNSESEVKAAIALNEKMEKLQSQFRSKSILSKMTVQDFVFTT